jgi:regulator of extracellular matrix RemA (YlzA/DUF370 family)
MFVSVGYKNVVCVSCIVAILEPDSAPIKKLKQDAKEKGLLVDCTKGHPTRSLLMMSNYQVYLSAVQPETLKARMDELIAQNKKMERKGYEALS